MNGQGKGKRMESQDANRNFKNNSNAKLIPNSQKKKKETEKEKKKEKKKKDNLSKISKIKKERCASEESSGSRWADRCRTYRLLYVRRALGRRTLGLI
jgi:hypothetical protein